MYGSWTVALGVPPGGGGGGGGGGGSSSSPGARLHQGASGKGGGEQTNKTYNCHIPPPLSHISPISSVLKPLLLRICLVYRALHHSPQARNIYYTVFHFALASR